MKRIINIHKYISLVVTVPVILWTLTGLLHPIMGWIKPKIKNNQSSIIFEWNSQDILKPDTTDLIELKGKLEQFGINQFQELRIVLVKSEYYFQIHETIGKNAIYYSPTEKKFIKGVDKHYAKMLSSIVTGRNKSEIESVEFIESFSTEYKSVNQILPVHRVEYSDGLAVFVENRTDRYVTAVDEARRSFNNLFELFHNFHWIPERIRHFGISFLMVLIFASSTFGFYLSRKIKRKNSENSNIKIRNEHRRLALFFSVSMLAFSFSGLYHFWQKEGKVNKSNYYDKNYILTEQLPNVQLPGIGAVQSMLLKPFGEDIFWQLSSPFESRYYHHNNLIEAFKVDSIYAVLLSKQFIGDGNSIISTSKVSKFKGEYGFINKRLPVIKVQYKDPFNTRLYIESKTGQLAAWIDDADALEGFSFAYLHKYHFLDFLGKNLRNIIMCLFALGNLIIIYSGLKILLRNK